jgi:hypothetical protein
MGADWQDPKALPHITDILCLFNPFEPKLFTPEILRYRRTSFSGRTQRLDPGQQVLNLNLSSSLTFSKLGGKKRSSATGIGIVELDQKGGPLTQARRNPNWFSVVSLS